ncbi:unnamed protein product [Ceutorhynchus assimilis]|uniref:SAM domain-containing protein n=1 Tax=Ceutorhynchus assimilis TaxID=467358 RepID=A0A9N9MN28_9CUCU|nr:unnamed protein product [Ceutorhynchus assimilis]
MAEEVKDLLESWNVPIDIINNFSDNNITLDHFSSLDDAFLKELCPPIGTRIQLKNEILEFLAGRDSTADTETIYSDSNGTTDGVELERVIEQDNLPGPSFTQKENLPGPSWQNADTSNDVSSGLEELEETLRNLIRPSLPEFDLKTLLQTSPLGNSVLQFYNANGSLDQKRRNRLVDIMIKHIFNYTYSETGKLVDKCRNLLYISGEKRTNRKRPLQETTDSTTEEGEEIGVKKQKLEELHKENILWLKVNQEPWNSVIVKWESTFEVRQTSEYVSVEDFLKNWPILLDLRGDILINLDFNRIYPGKGTHFFEKWQTFFTKILEIRKKDLPSNDPYIAALLDSLDTIEDNDSKITTQITLLPHLIPPKGRTVIEKKHWKFSTQESVESLVVLVKNPGDIEKTIAEQKEKSLNKKQRVQPYILVDGPDLINFRRIFLVVDTLRYQFDCPKKAFDILFKAYHVFKAKYPLPGEHIYLLIQRCIYKIKTKYDIIQPYVLNILQQLE